MRMAVAPKSQRERRREALFQRGKRRYFDHNFQILTFRPFLFQFFLGGGGPKLKEIKLHKSYMEVKAHKISLLIK